jgi:hypothetical protein
VKHLCITLTLFAASAAIAARLPFDRIEVHKRADAVLWPQFIAASNEYALNHGGPNDPGHFEKLSAKDVQNIRAVRETFAAWNEAMKQAGY